MPFLMYYVQRLNYAEIGSILEMERIEVMDTLDRSTRAAAAKLQSDDRAHPRRRKTWER
jgi:DNA-directed RNA polymerase specialized sigma24 family protein